MSTKVLNSLSHSSGKKKYKFLKKKDRLNLVEIGEWRHWTEPVRQEKLKKPNFTFFREALEHWLELDVSADFVSFRQKTNLYGYSLSLLLRKRRRILKLLLNRLRKRPKTIAFQSLCSCLVAFVRDIRHRFVEYIPVTWKVLTQFMDFENEEILSCIFSTLNGLGRLLWEPLLNHFPKTWELWKPLIIHKTRQIRILSAQCFGFVLRKGVVEDLLPKIGTRLLQEATIPLQDAIKDRKVFQDTVDGVCECFMQMLFSPIGKQLFSKADLVLKTLLESTFIGNEQVSSSGFIVLQQLFMNIMREIPQSGTEWIVIHLVDVLQRNLVSDQSSTKVNDRERIISCLDCYLLLCLVTFCCENDSFHIVTVDTIRNAILLIFQLTEPNSYNTFTYSCLFYSLENLLLQLLMKDTNQLKILYSQILEKYICSPYFPLFLERMIISASSQDHANPIIDMLWKNTLFWEQFKVHPDNAFHWRVLLALYKQRKELCIDIDSIRQLFTSAVSNICSCNGTQLFMSLLDICCEIQDEVMLCDWESYLENNYVRNRQLDSSSKRLMARVCSKMLISGCPLSNLFHEWFQELVFLEEIIETQVLHGVATSLETKGILWMKLTHSFHWKQSVLNHSLKHLFFSPMDRRQAILELLSTIGKLLKWDHYSLMELILAVEKTPKSPTHISESLLKTQRIIDYLQSKRKELSSVADNCPVMYVLCFECVTWLQYELSPVQPNIYQLWKCLCNLCPNTTLFTVKQAFSTELQWTTGHRSISENESLVSSEQQRPKAETFLLRWMQSTRKYFKSFLFYYETLQSDPSCNKLVDVSVTKDEDCLDERLNLKSWHMQLLKAVETTLPESKSIASYLLESYFMTIVSSIHKKKDVSFDLKLLEHYLSLFLCCCDEQREWTTFATEWKKKNYQTITKQLSSIIVSGKGNIQQLALSCQIRCIQPYLASYETWLSRLQSNKQFKEVYTQFYSAIFQDGINQDPKTLESSLHIQVSHLMDMKKLVLHILIGKLSDISEKSKLETCVFTLLSGFREPEDVNLVWCFMWQPLLDYLGLNEVEEILEHINDLSFKEKLGFNRCLEKLQKAIPLSLFSLNRREVLLRWCIGCMQEDGNVDKENRQQLRSLSLYLLSSIIESSLPLSEVMTCNIFEWLVNTSFTLERYQPSDGQTPAMIVTLCKITSCETLTCRIVENEHLSRCCVELVLKFIQYARQNEETLLYCISIWKNLWNIAQQKNILSGWLQRKSTREEIWIALANNILRTWSTMKHPGKLQLRKLGLLDSLLEMILQYDYYQEVTLHIDEQLQDTFLKLLNLLVSLVGNSYFWKYASSVTEKIKDLLALYIQRMDDSQEWLSYHIYSKLPCILFQFKNVVSEDRIMLEKMDKMFLELCKCLAEKLSDRWLNTVLERLPDMLSSVGNENAQICVERRVSALDIVISNVESLLDPSSEHSFEHLHQYSEQCHHPPSCIALVLLSWACFRNIVVDDFSLRNLGGRGLTVIGRCLLAQLKNNTSNSFLPWMGCDVLLQYLVDTCRMFLFSQCSFGLQRLLMMALGTWVYIWYSSCSQTTNRTTHIPDLECFFPMVSGSLQSIEESWFANMVHLQVHRRCRACIQISHKVDSCQLYSDRLLKFAISWTLERYLESITMNVDGNMERWYQVMRVLVDTSIHRIAWEDYKHYLERILKKWIHLKDSRHPTSKKEWNLWIKLGEIFITFLPKWMDVDNKNEEEMLQVEARNDTGDIKSLSSPCQKYMEERLIPFLARILKELGYSSVSIGEKKYSSITPLFADLLVRSLQNMADSHRERYFNEILGYLKSQIRSKSQRQRDLARNCFCSMIKCWGISYLRRISDATRTSCQDGFRVYVLRYSIFCYVKCLSENKMSIQDSELIKEWMEIFHEEICSIVDDQERRIPYQECKEVSSFYIYDALTFMAKILQGKEKWELWRYLLNSCCELNRVKNPSKKKRVVQKLFPHLVRSLTTCPDLDVSQALWFVYSLMKERQPLEQNKYLDESAILMLEFALQFLYRLLKLLNKKVDSNEYENVLETFFPLVSQLFGTKNEFLCSHGLRIIQLLWKVTALPCTPTQWMDIFHYASSLLSNATRLNASDTSSNASLVHAAIETLSSIISKIPANYNQSWQEDCIVPLIRIIQHLFSYVSGDWMLWLLKLIRTFVTCRYGFRTPEMFSLINTLTQIAIQSSEKKVRENIVSIFIDFVLHYPIPESIFHEYLLYFTSNLRYPYCFGRQTSATILFKWLQSSATSSIWKEKEMSLFIAVSAQIANEEDLDCRETFSRLLTTIFSCMDEQRRLDTLNVIEEWSSNEKEELQLVSISVVECLCDISSLTKSEVAFFLKLIGTCLHKWSLQFSSLEMKDVHYAFGTLLSCMQRILKHRPDWIVRESFLDIWKCIWKNDLFATSTLSVRRKLDDVICSFVSSLETLSGATERKAQHLLLVADTENTFVAALLNCCVNHLSLDPLTDEIAKCISENINRLLNWIEKYRSDNVLQSIVETTSLDCLKKLSKLAATPNVPSDSFGTLRRQLALELVRDRLKMKNSILSTSVSNQESYARTIIKMMLRCWRDFGEAQGQAVNMKRRKREPLDAKQDRNIQVVLHDIEYFLSRRMSSEYQIMLNSMREEYMQRRKSRKVNKNSC